MNIQLIAIKKTEGVFTMTGFARRSAVMALLLSLVSAGAGCHSVTMKRFAVNVKIGDDLKETLDVAQSKSSDNKYPNIEVDIVGVPDSGYAYWSSIKMSDYWDYTPGGKPNDARASASKKTLELGGVDQLALPMDDPIWDTWQNEHVMHLFVLSSYPRAAEDQPGDTDTRRAIINLSSDNWDKHLDHVDVRVYRNRITLITPPKQEKPQ